MDLLSIDCVRIAAVNACLPQNEIDNFADCERFFGEKTASTVGTIGILKRRIASTGTTSADLCIRAAEEIFKNYGKNRIGAVLSVTFTPAKGLPGNAFLAQKRLELANDVLAIDLHHACAGYPYALYIAALVAKNTGKAVLVLDGDIQSRIVAPDDKDLVPVLSDAGSATVIEPGGSDTWRFAFLSDGSQAGVLDVKTRNSPLFMDGFEVFRFVATQATAFLKSFIASAQVDCARTLFIPHQANIYMIRNLAATLGFGEDSLAIAGDRFGNSSSSTIPVALAAEIAKKRKPNVLFAGFGAGMAASAAFIPWHGDTQTSLFDYAT